MRTFGAAPGMGTPTPSSAMPIVPSVGADSVTTAIEFLTNG